MTRRLALAALATTVLLAACAKGPDNIPYNEAKYALSLLSRTTTRGVATDVWVSGSRAYVCDSEQGVTIWDVSNPGAPACIDTLRTSASPIIALYSPMTNLLVVNERNPAGLTPAYDMTTKTAAAILPWDSGISDIDMIEFHPDTLFLARVDGGSSTQRGEGFGLVKLYRFPGGLWETDLRTRFEQPPFGNYRGLKLWGLQSDTIFVAFGSYGLHVLRVDFSTFDNFPFAPIGYLDTPGSAEDIDLNRSGTHALIADSHNGLQIVDVSDRTNPRLGASIIPEGFNQTIKVMAVGDTAYCLERLRGIWAADVSIPSQPRLIAVYRTSRPEGLFVTDNHTIYVADEYEGLMILRWR
ncbi:MAG: hypothetical protein FJY67_02105 [Calditrichaeota bacterium]|nr:hypothetical protein [Calditrichota bacterium]